MQEQNLEVIMGLIMNSGNAKSDAMEACTTLIWPRLPHCIVIWA